MTLLLSRRLTSVGVCGCWGSGGWASSTLPSAMPTRSAPNSLAFALMMAGVSWAMLLYPCSFSLPLGEGEKRRGKGLESTHIPLSHDRCALLRFTIDSRALSFFRRDVPFLPDPADVPGRQAGHFFPGLAVGLHVLGQSHLLPVLLWDLAVLLREPFDIVVPHRADFPTAPAVTKGADDA